MDTMTPTPPSEPSGRGRRIGQWLFNPFQFIAGGRALVVGLVVIALSALLGSVTDTHFDGVLDVHTGAEAPLWFFGAEGLVDWLCAAIVLALLAKLIGRRRFRLSDVLGTQALARWPYVLIVAIMLISPIRDALLRVAESLMHNAAQGTPLGITLADGLLSAAFYVVMLTTIVWTVTLMYRAYLVSTGIKGGLAISTFIIGLVLAEVLSKAILWRLAHQASLSAMAPP